MGFRWGSPWRSCSLIAGAAWPLQVLGLIGCAPALLLAALGAGGDQSTDHLVLIVAGFLLFQFMTNFGPNATTYLLAGEVFPTRIRGC